jgi:hypothetical protein
MLSNRFGQCRAQRQTVGGADSLGLRLEERVDKGARELVDDRLVRDGRGEAIDGGRTVAIVLWVGAHVVHRLGEVGDEFLRLVVVHVGQANVHAGAGRVGGTRGEVQIRSQYNTHTNKHEIKSYHDGYCRLLRFQWRLPIASATL